MFDSRGLGPHRKACKQEFDRAQDQARFMANRRLQRQGEQTGHTDGCVADLSVTAGNLNPQPTPGFPVPVMADTDAHDVPHTDTTFPQDLVSSI
jgi:hypothetical protein